MSRVSAPRLVTLANQMPLRERQIVETVARLSLVSGRQLSDLFSSSFSVSVDAASRARLIRRALEQLVAVRALERMGRRQGGAGGGSGSWVYALGPAGRRLIAYWAGEGLPRSRTTHEPGVVWTAHALAVSDLYVRLRKAEDAGRIEVLTFDAEPACWRTYTRLGGTAATLKPDAYVRLGVGEFEDSFFVEVDLSSERRGQLTRQHRAYREYFRSGGEQTKTGVFALVLWVVPDTRRATLLKDIQRGLGEPTLFAVATAEQTLAVLCDQVPATTAEGTT